MKKKNTRGLFLITVGLLLITAALCLSIYNIWDNNRASKVSGDTVKLLLDELNSAAEGDSSPKTESETVGNDDAGNDKGNNEGGDNNPNNGITPPEPPAETTPELPIYVRNPNMEMPIKTVDGVDYVGIVSLPSINVTLPVIAQCTNQLLKLAPCKFFGSVYKDDMVIAAHNYDAHFGRITSLKIGDSVVFTDMDGNVFEFEVAGHELIDGNDVDGMTMSGWDMTLFACNYSGDKRTAVRCERKNDQQFSVPFIN